MVRSSSPAWGPGELQFAVAKDAHHICRVEPIFARGAGLYNPDRSVSHRLELATWAGGDPAQPHVVRRVCRYRRG
jgi:hypothetical protein